MDDGRRLEGMSAALLPELLPFVMQTEVFH